MCTSAQETFKCPDPRLFLSKQRQLANSQKSRDLNLCFLSFLMPSYLLEVLPYNVLKY
jgi:hypothetical protein